MAVVVAALSGGDRQSLVQAINAVCGESRWMQSPRFQSGPAWRHALDVPSCPDHLLLVARQGSRVVGWCRLLPCAYPEPSDYELGIGLLVAYRRQGLGREMVGRALAWALAHGIGQIVLTTHHDNLPARRLFETSGFTYTGQGADGWLEMASRLAAPGG